jgi:hypothetical protein
MRELGKEPSSLEIARFYHGLIDTLVVDRADAALAASIAALGIRPLVTSAVMKEPRDRVALARCVMDCVHSPAALSPTGSAA